MPALSLGSLSLDLVGTGTLQNANNMFIYIDETHDDVSKDLVRGEMEWISHRESHRSGSGGAGTSKSKHVCWRVVVLPMSLDLPLCTDN